MSEYLRRNVLGVVAIFIALSGTAAALPGKNKVDSGDIKNANVKLADLAANAVDGSKVVDNSLKGGDVDESSLDIPQQALPTSLPPSGAAGGDLSGSYPDPQVSESGLAAGGDLSGTLANAQVGESGLALGGDLTGTVASAAIADGSVDEAAIENAEREITVPINESNNPVTNQAGSSSAEYAVLAPASNPSAATPVLLYSGTFNEVALFSTAIPADRVPGTPVSIDIDWSPAASGSTGANAVRWFVEFSSLGLNDDVTPDGNGQQVDPAAPAIAGSQDRVRSSTFELPGAQIANGDALMFEIARGGANAQDTLASDAQLHFVTVRYTAER